MTDKEYMFRAISLAKKGEGWTNPNPIFFHDIKTKTPYVVMKYGMTLDGKIATKTGESKWVTGKEISIW